MKQWRLETVRYLSKARCQRFKYKIEENGHEVYCMNGFYYGESKDGKPHGVGVLIACYDTTETLGEWKDGWLHGKYCQFHPELKYYVFEEQMHGKRQGRSLQVGSETGKKLQFFKEGKTYGQVRSYAPDFRYYHQSIYDEGSVAVRGKKVYIREDDLIFYR